MPLDPTSMILPRRPITGISAILLTFQPNRQIDWPAFQKHLLRTADAGLTPAVNMDTGFVHLLDEPTRLEVLTRTQNTLDSRPFVAGAFISDAPGAPFDSDPYARQIDLIQSHNATPVIFPSFGLNLQTPDRIVAAYQTLAARCDKFIAFELGPMFAPCGKIYDLDTFTQIMSLPQCLGLKHSSLDRRLEWLRLLLRNQIRPDFKIYTGNDLAIDMVIYGSDYLLGLSTFAPDAFALRDQYWLTADPRFYPLNDLLQYLGCFAFRHPVPAYKHSAAQFLKLRGHLNCSATHPDSPSRPHSDLEVLQNILHRLEPWLK